MPSLRKRKLPSGRSIWDIRYWEKGKQRVYTIGETDRRTATKIYGEFCSRLAEGNYDGTVITVDTIAESVSAHKISDLAQQARVYAEANKSQKTLEREQFVFRRIITVLGDLPITELTAAKMEEYKAIRLKVAASPTINIEIRVLNTALNQAIAMNWLSATPKQHFKQIRLPEPEPLAWLNQDQIQVLLSTEHPEFRRFLQFLLYTGCRRNEALGVAWVDVDLDKRQIVIRSQIGKMGKRRTIPVSDELASVMDSWPLPREGKLFPRYQPNQVSMKFRRWAHDVGMPKGISLHSLRATFACHLIKNGVDIYTVSKLLGHSSVKVTEKHYLALDPDHVRSAVNQLNFRTGRGPDGKLKRE